LFHYSQKGWLFVCSIDIAPLGLSPLTWVQVQRESPRGKTDEGTGEEVTGETIAEAPRTLKLTNPLMQGEDVRQVQEALKTAGINLEPDGVFGNDTEKAVRKF